MDESVSPFPSKHANPTASRSSSVARIFVPLASPSISSDPISTQLVWCSDEQIVVVLAVVQEPHGRPRLALFVRGVFGAIGLDGHVPRVALRGLGLGGGDVHDDGSPKDLREDQKLRLAAPERGREDSFAVGLDGHLEGDGDGGGFEGFALLGRAAHGLGDGEAELVRVALLLRRRQVLSLDVREAHSLMDARRVGVGRCGSGRETVETRGEGGVGTFARLRIVRPIGEGRVWASEAEGTHQRSEHAPAVASNADVAVELGLRFPGRRAGAEGGGG